MICGGVLPATGPVFNFRLGTSVTLPTGVSQGDVVGGMDGQRNNVGTGRTVQDTTGALTVRGYDVLFGVPFAFNMRAGPPARPHSLGAARLR